MVFHIIERTVNNDSVFLYFNYYTLQDCVIKLKMKEIFFV